MSRSNHGGKIPVDLATRPATAAVCRHVTAVVSHQLLPPMSIGMILVNHCREPPSWAVIVTRQSHASLQIRKDITFRVLWTSRKGALNANRWIKIDYLNWTCNLRL